MLVVKWAPRWLVFVVACIAVGATACSLDARGLATSVEPPAGNVADASTANADDASRGATPDAAESSDDAGEPDDSSAEPDAPLSSGDASVAPDGAVSACDQDGDGHKATGSVCNGDDCCDLDPHAYPGEPNFFTTPSACGSFDYNCDGKQTQEFGVVNCSLGFFTCNGDGFKSDTPCGSTQAYEQCNLAFASCSKSEAPKTQGCR